MVHLEAPARWAASVGSLKQGGVRTNNCMAHHTRH
jgi:hypothetical protein